MKAEDVYGLITATCRGLLEALGITSGGVVVPVARPTTAITTGVGSETVLTSGQSGYYVSNVGTTVKASCTLPTAAAGLRFFFSNVDSDGFRINASTGDTIRLGHMVTATAGYVESVTVGSSVTLTAVDATQWIAESGISGTWRADSTTSAGFAFTPSAWTTQTCAATWSTNTTISCRSQQIGNRLHLVYDIVTSGAPDAVALRVDLPSGYAMPAQPDNGYPVGWGVVYDSGGAGLSYDVLVVTLDANTFEMFYRNAATSVAAITQAAPVGFGSNDQIDFEVEVTVS